MKKRASSENPAPSGRPQSSPATPILSAVRAEMASLYRTMLDDRARLERQRRRVDALLWEGIKATAPRELLGTMERAFSLKEIYLDHLIDVSGEMDHGPRLHDYDLDQRAQRFGVTGAVLRTTVMQVGPALERVEAALASQKDTKLMQASSTEGAAVRSQRRSGAMRANSPRPKEGVHG